jgi:hypothetical protein
MAASIFLQATSGAVESSTRNEITPNHHEITKGKEYEAPRGQPQKMSVEARFLVVTAADLVALTSRLQTAPTGADYLFFSCSFQANLAGEDIESKTLTETVMFFSIFLVLLPHVLPFSRDFLS